MSSQSIGELARSRSLDYARSPRKKKSAILDEFALATGVRRKTAITLLRDPPPIKPRPRGKPKERYGAEVRAALELLWAASGHRCAKRLVPGLAGLIAMMEAHKESLWSGQTKEKLLKLSASTCDRLLRAKRKSFMPAGRCMTKPGSLLKSQIPIRTWSDWPDEEPGYCETDLVHHCENNTSGEYLHTITLTDVVLGWTENEALRNRSEKSVVLAASVY